MTRGRFITFEGGEGAGKSTQARLVAERLRQSSVDVMATREPGGSPGAEAIRNLLAAGTVDRWLPVSELLMFFAARLDHVERTIKPALAAGTWVISDRFLDSTEAYQGYGLGLDRTTIAKVRALSIGDFRPDLTFIFDLEPETGLGRAVDRQRYEAMDLAFHRRLREGYLAIASADPGRCLVLDAARPQAEVTNAIMDELTRRFGAS